MKSNGTDRHYPRPLSSTEREFIGWILPENVGGYRRVLDRISHLVVIGEGRRGSGEYILGEPGSLPDLDAPLPGVFAYGVIESDFGTISVTLREERDRQFSLEIVNSRSEEIPEEFEESRRWTYSGWKRGDVCPQCRKPIRQVAMRDTSVNVHVLAICTSNSRIWVLDGTSGIVHPIPITNFYNELMLGASIRDPGIALDSKRLFAECDRYSDRQLALAFESYNRLRKKIAIAGSLHIEEEPRGSMMQSLKRLLSEGNT